jgi:hypothetical protein
LSILLLKEYNKVNHFFILQVSMGHLLNARHHCSTVEKGVSKSLRTHCPDKDCWLARELEINPTGQINKYTAI